MLLLLAAASSCSRVGAETSRSPLRAQRESFQRHETSPQWSPQRNFTLHGVRKSRRDLALSKQHGGSPAKFALHNVTLNYFLFTPLVATGAPLGLWLDPDAPRLPLLCFLHGYGDKPRNEALGVFTDADHQKRLPLFVLRPGSAKTSNWASSLRPRSGSHNSRISTAQNVLLALLDRLLGELPVDPRSVSTSNSTLPYPNPDPNPDPNP